MLTNSSYLYSLLCYICILFSLLTTIVWLNFSEVNAQIKIIYYYQYDFFPYKCYLNISAQTFTTSYWGAHYLKVNNITAQTFTTSYWVAHYLKVNNITAMSSYPFLTLIILLYNNWLKLIFFFQIIIIIDLNYVSFSKLPFNNNETNFQIEQIVLLISLSIVLTLYIILELPLFDCIIIINSCCCSLVWGEDIYRLVLLSNPFQYFSE